MTSLAPTSRSCGAASNGTSSMLPTLASSDSQPSLPASEPSAAPSELPAAAWLEATLLARNAARAATVG